MSNFDDVKLGSPPPYPGHPNPDQPNVVPVYPGAYNNSFPNATSTPIPPRNNNFPGYPNPPQIQPIYTYRRDHDNQCYYVDGRRPRTVILVSADYRRRRAMYGGLALLVFVLPILIFLIIFYSIR